MGGKCDVEPPGVRFCNTCLDYRFEEETHRVLAVVLG